MLHRLKCSIARSIGRTMEECREAFEEGQAQGKILAEKYKVKAEAKAKPKDNEPEVYTVG